MTEKETTELRRPRVGSTDETRYRGAARVPLYRRWMIRRYEQAVERGHNSSARALARQMRSMNMEVPRRG